MEPNNRKTLVIIRHAHAEQINKDTPQDFDRVLTERGQQEASETGKHLAGKLPEPVLILASAAKRTEQTAEIVAQSLRDAPVVCKKELYKASPDDWLLEMHRTQESTATRVFVGHNPTVSELCSRLGEDEVDLATGEARIYQAEGEWTTLAEDAWKEVWLA